MTIKNKIMATQLNPDQWEKTLSLDRHGPSLHILNISTLPANKSFLHSQKLKQEDSPTFLLADHEKKIPMKKISFKIKKTSSVYRRNQNKVAELAKKFEKCAEEPEFRKFIKRVNSQRSMDSDKVTRKPSVVTRKPSVKTKPVFSSEEKIIVRRINRKLEKNRVKIQERPNNLCLEEKRPTSLSVRATIEIFERRNSESTPNTPISVPKPKVPETKTDGFEDEVQIVNIPAVLPQRRCDSMYETLNLKKIPPQVKSKSEEAIPTVIKPNTSFLWKINQDKSPSNSYNPIVKDDDWKSLYDFVDPRPLEIILKNQKKPKEDKIYEELNGYEYCEVGNKKSDEENIYEILPPPLLPRRQQQEPLPPRPPSRGSYCTIQNSDNSNCYESIYNPDSNKVEVESNYESIYGCQIRLGGSNRDSLVSSDQLSNSLYGRTSFVGWGENYSGKATSDLSGSDRSDDWVDVTDNEDNDNSNSGIIIVREKHKKKTTGWVQQFREQWSKTPRRIPPSQGADSDTDHHYESLCATSREECIDDDYDSFDSDTESENSFTKINLNDSGVDIANNQLPDPPQNQTYVLTRLAATAGKHMRKLRRNWSLTKSDISKSLSRMTKRKSRTDLETVKKHEQRKSSPEISLKVEDQNMEAEAENKTLRKGFLNKFRRSMSLSAELANEVTSSLDNKPKSTFYLTDNIDIEEQKNESETSRDSGASLSPVQRNSKIIRPQSPPPPVPVNKARKDKRATSWYAEVGLFKNENIAKRPNTFWYAEVGLYPPGSTPSTSSAENSGNNINEEYYNLKNGSEYYNDSISSIDTKKDTSITPDIQLRLQDEPLYQFYDAAVLESVCHDGTSSSDFDSDGYEEVDHRRPSAMELVSPSRNSIAFTKTLWCEIPEVIQSSVLSTLSTHQRKLQEAKFEILTSEASYLNSLNVLLNHFVVNLRNSNLLTLEDEDLIFGKITDVKSCSEKLLYDLEMCWQDNILLHGVCDIVQKHAEENFSVYVPYCENQILLDDTLKKNKEKPAFLEILRQLESSSVCQSLTLYSFLMLPMQRITRLPLLIDAVLKRLSQQDSEYVTCQYCLATLNKIVNQCNEGARTKERENEMKKLVNQLEFGKGMPQIDVLSENRWLVRSGSVTHMQQRTDEVKLTFGKRFVKITLHLFLFNDLLLVTKPKSENLYTVIHYCPRNLVELSSTDIITSLPVKDTQTKNLLFLTILENQIEKTVELLLSCSSESDKERWVEALTPPKSEDPNETLYECWDCPQVTAIHSYTSSQPDELALSRGDVINVLRKMADGWYHGERIRDGQIGWFPANYTIEVANPHVRSRNLKQRYRLLAFSENYLKTK